MTELYKFYIGREYGESEFIKPVFKKVEDPEDFKASWCGELCDMMFGDDCSDGKFFHIFAMIDYHPVKKKKNKNKS